MKYKFSTLKSANRLALILYVVYLLFPPPLLTTPSHYRKYIFTDFEID